MGRAAVLDASSMMMGSPRVTSFALGFSRSRISSRFMIRSTSAAVFGSAVAHTNVFHTCTT